MTAMHLSDYFVDDMAYVTSLMRALETEQPAYEEVKNEIRRLLSQSEANAARELVAPDEYDQARFAICAWIDEAVITSQWLHKNRWVNDQLQRLHYNTTDAGEEFFRRLDGVGLHQQELREVYYLCLAHGFVGRYCQPGDAYRLEEIKTSHLKLLLGSSADLPSLEGVVLCPEAYPNGPMVSDTANLTATSRLVSAVFLAAPMLLFAILFLVYHFTLSGIGGNFLRTVTN